MNRRSAIISTILAFFGLGAAKAKPSEQLMEFLGFTSNGVSIAPIERPETVLLYGGLLLRRVTVHRLEQRQCLDANCNTVCVMKMAVSGYVHCEAEPWIVPRSGNLRSIGGRAFLDHPANCVEHKRSRVNGDTDKIDLWLEFEGGSPLI